MVTVDKAQDVDTILENRVLVAESRLPFQNLLLGLPLVLGRENVESELSQFLALLRAQLTTKKLFPEKDIETLASRILRIVSGHDMLRRVAVVNKFATESVAELDEFSLTLEVRPILDGAEVLGFFPVACLKIASSAPNGSNPKSIETRLSLQECLKISRMMQRFWTQCNATKESLAANNIELLDTLDLEELNFGGAGT
jgi:hypothetical protein